jgi:hypothetical protein
MPKAWTLLLHRAFERPRAELRVVALLRQQFVRGVIWITIPKSFLSWGRFLSGEMARAAAPRRYAFMFFVSFEFFCGHFLWLRR